MKFNWDKEEIKEQTKEERNEAMNVMIDSLKNDNIVNG